MSKFAVKPDSNCRTLLVLGGLLLACSSAQAIAMTYELRDLHFVGPSGQNGLPLAVDILEPGVVGHFVWSYQPGDFSNGTGKLLDITLPIASLPPSAWTSNVDATGLTGTYAGNAQNTTFDFTIRFSPALSAAGGASAIDPAASSFAFTGSYQGSSPFVEWTGNIVGGSVSPIPEPARPWLMIAGLLLVAQTCCRNGRATQRPKLAPDE
ncbi:hypothetical protein BH11PSE8_BH11PSE8_40020 [soil metagenome]